MELAVAELSFLLWKLNLQVKELFDEIEPQHSQITSTQSNTATTIQAVAMKRPYSQRNATTDVATMTTKRVRFEDTSQSDPIAYVYASLIEQQTAGMQQPKKIQSVFYRGFKMCKSVLKRRNSSDATYDGASNRGEPETVNVPFVDDNSESGKGNDSRRGDVLAIDVDEKDGLRDGDSML